jgi:hypothetical protein
MAIQTINLGTYANDGTGDDLRTAFEKVQANFVEIYSSLNGARVGPTPPTSDVGEGELWWNTLDGRLYIKHNASWVDASPSDPIVHYNISAETTAGGARLQLSGTDSSLDSVTFESGTNITVTRTNSNIITLSSTSYTGDINGNASTVTNGVYTTGSYSDPSWITSIAGSKISGNINGRAGTVTNGVYTTSSINALADVDTVSVAPTNGQALVWNSGTSQWKPGTITPGGVTKIIAGTNITISPTNGLGDVTINSTATGGGAGNLDFGTFLSPLNFGLDLGTF